MGKMQYDYSDRAVSSLIEWAMTAQLPKELRISDSELVTDTSMYVQANINDINAHYPDAFYNPAIDRLYKLKEKVEATE